MRGILKPSVRTKQIKGENWKMVKPNHILDSMEQFSKLRDIEN